MAKKTRKIQLTLITIPYLFVMAGQISLFLAMAVANPDYLHNNINTTLMYGFGGILFMLTGLFGIIVNKMRNESK